jgi:hypothetical protein
MSGDTILAIIAVSLTAIFISVFAIECDRVWQRYRASRRREMEERAWFSRRQDRCRGRPQHSLVLVDDRQGPDDARGRVATLYAFQKSWGAWKAWAKLEKVA